MPISQLENDRHARRYYQQLILSLALFLYPAWTAVHLFWIPEISVNLPLRAAIIGSLAVSLWLVKKDAFGDGTVADWIIFAIICAIVVHAYRLYVENLHNMVILLRVYILISVIPIVLISRKQLLLFMILVVLLSIGVVRYHPDSLSFGFFTLGTITFFTTQWFTQPMRTWTIRALRNSNAEIQSLVDRQNILIGRLGHDLRTPLVPLTALLPKLEPHLHEQKARDVLALVIRNAEYMRNLVERTLSYSKVHSGTEQLRLEKFDLAVLVDEALATFRNQELNKPVVFDNGVPRDLTVRADRYRILEVLYNLISNSVRYMPQGGTIRIEARETGGIVWVSVTDEGIGLSRDQLSHLFAPFYKADGARGDHTSVGLGLVICQQIMTLHGQKVAIESPGLGKGTTVSFSLERGE